MTVSLDEANSLPSRSDELFRIFARFEFALKMAGFHNQQCNGIEVTWDSFSNDVPLGKAFFQHIYKQGVCPTLMQYPPKSETIESGQWGFSDETNAPKSSQELFGAVRRVRNNLFHGGKYFDDDSGRNERLVAEAILILLEALEWHDGVRFYFEGKA